MRQFKPGQLRSGSLYPITSSFAVTASYALNLDTRTLTTTASFNAFTASYTTGSFTGSFKGDGSQLTGIVSSKWTGSNPISRESDVEITGSLRVQGSITASLFGTASNAISSSYSIQALSASYAPFVPTNTGSLLTTASISNATITFTKGDGTTFPVTVNNVVSSSFATTASYAFSSLSSSYSVTSSYSTYAETASSATNAQDILIYTLNNSGYDIAKGTVVHITASGNSSDVPRIISASYENDANSANTLGIATQLIANGSNGYVMTEGVLKGINTSNFVSGQMLYLGASGSIIGVAPDAPLHSVRLGQVVRVQQNNGSIYIRIDNGYELQELHDVLVTSASAGDLIIRSGGVWTNTKQLTGSYNLTGSLNTRGGILIRDTSSNIVFDSVNKTLYDSNGITSINWAARTLQSSNLTQSIDYDRRLAIDKFGTVVINWDKLRLLNSNEIIVVDWDSLYLNDINEVTSVDWSGRYLYNTNGDIVFDWENAIITASLNGTASFASIASFAQSGTGIFTGSLFGTSSWSNNSISSSFSLSSSFSTQALSSSFAVNAQSATTASYILNAISASFALTSSVSQRPLTTTGSTLYSTSPATTNVSPNNGVFLGSSAGGGALNSNFSVFLGYLAGQSATNANESVFIGPLAGAEAANAPGTIALGSGAGYRAVSASYSTLLGYYVGSNTDASTSIGSGNIIIGNNITLPAGTRNSINLGAIIFATGSYSSLGAGNLYSGSQAGIGRVGINKVTPNYTLDVSGSGNFSNGLTITGSLNVNGSITGSLFGTASWANNSISSSFSLSSSFATQALSSSFATTASFAPNYVLTSETSSMLQPYVLSSNTSSFITNSQTSSMSVATASYVLNAVSSSFASTVPASGVIGLNLSQIATGSVTASVSPTQFSVTSGSSTELIVRGNGVSIGNILADTHTITGSLSITGSQNITGSLTITQNITSSRAFISSSTNTASGSTLTVYGSGSALPVFTVQGSQGELFSVTDSLSGSLFSVNEISGLPIIEVFSDSTLVMGNYVSPMLTTTARVTQTNSGSFVVYNIPTSSYDTVFFEYSTRSGSNARAGTIMAIQSGSSVNFTETTTTDFGTTSAISFGVFVTGSNIALTGSSTTGLWTTKCIIRGI